MIRPLKFRAAFPFCKMTADNKINPAERKTKARVLVADDEPGVRMALETALRLSGYSVAAAPDGETALAAGRASPFDLLLTDVYMPGISGLDLVREFREFSPQTRIIVMTAQGSLEIAMQAVEEGAFDFIAKPFEIEEVINLVARATRRDKSGAETPVDPGYSGSGLLGHSPQMVRVYKLIAHAARTDSTVLIEGETGTGKELVATAIHQNSFRASKRFMAVNCSALTETLLESELFGYTRGSFTGAGADRPGLFESSGGGTVFLDEISSASPSLQASLLRVLQEREVRRVGSSETRNIDVRVIAASNTGLEQMAKNGGFRNDLFYRLSVINIELPPLRDRGLDDIVLLTGHFLGKAAGSSVSITEDALNALSNYDWPGNVRELQNTIEYAAAVCTSGRVTVDDLPPRVLNCQGLERPPAARPVFSLADDRPTLDELSRRYVGLVLAENGGNKSRAAEILGINRRTLYRYADGIPADPADIDGVIDETDADSA
jgi:two-component system, NtrC family, response regulator AtoC